MSAFKNQGFSHTSGLPLRNRKVRPCGPPLPLPQVQRLELSSSHPCGQSTTLQLATAPGCPADGVHSPGTPKAFGVLMPRCGYLFGGHKLNREWRFPLIPAEPLKKRTSGHGSLDQAPGGGEKAGELGATHSSRSPRPTPASSLRAH